MGNIVLLDDLTINKIAAGEVIERPASVVKELLENSIDAGSKNITVEIKNGGISMIKITDDGIGIAEDDMEIAFERHATSKIRRAEDLATVTSMGFRGEALASIAAISKVEMISKKKDTNSAYKIIVEGGKITDFCETVRNVGTTITVENLFYNTPVRYKFLKKDYTEAGYVEDVVNRIALVNLRVAIKLISNGKTIFQTNGMGDIKNAIYNIYGKDTALETVKVDYEYEEIRVSGVVGNPVIARSNRSNQLFFLNGRFIKDKNITAAVDQAFKGIVPVGRYGFAILNLQMDPKEVDVNVHPAKLEVRFEDESKVFKAVYHAIKSCLTSVNNTEAEKQDTFDFMNSFYQSKKNYQMENTNPINYKKSKYEYNYNKPIDDSLSKKYSADSIMDNGIKNNSEYDGKKSAGIVGLFKRIIKEPDETEDEINNNYLADIYKSNYGLGEGTKISIKDNEINKNELLSDNNTNSTNISNPNDINNGLNMQNTVNDNLINKSVMLGNALISSNTMQINVAGSENAGNINDNIQTFVVNKTDNDTKPQEIVTSDTTNNNDINEGINEGINEAFRKVIGNRNSNTQEINMNAVLDDTQIIGNIKKSWENSNIEDEDFYKDNLVKKDEIFVGKNNEDETNEEENVLDNNTREIEIANNEVKDDTIVSEINNDINKATNVSMDDNDDTEMLKIKEDKNENTNIIDTKEDTNENVNNFAIKGDTDEVYLNNLEDNDNAKIESQNANDTQVITNDNKEDVITDEKDESANDVNDETKNDIESVKYNSQDDDKFAEIASGIIEAKMELDSTQMVDTRKVREALGENPQEEPKPEFEEMYKKTFGIETFSQRKEKELENIEKQKNDISNSFEYVNTPNLNVFDENETYKIPYKYIGIVFDNYILIEIKDEIFIVNHISANGKIIYEQLSNNYFNNEEIDENQFLLLPDIISLTDKELLLARENVEMFAKAGFIYEEFGDKTIKLVSVPSICEKLNTKQLFKDILVELDKVAITAKDEKADKFLATIADKVSSRVSERLDNDIAKSIIDDLLGLKDPFGDLLGKPIAIKMTKSDLEKKFSRK